MPRVKGGPRGHKRHVKILKLAKGYRGARHRLLKKSTEAVVRAGEHAFTGRRQRRRDMRRLWIARISGGLTQIGSDLKYSRFIDALKKADVDLNRKMLADMAATDLNSFKKVVETVKQNITK